MYIRKVKKTNGKSKKLYQTLHLVESIRTVNGPRQRLILNLGNLDIAENEYSILASKIEDILIGGYLFCEADEKIEKIAIEASRKLIDKNSVKTEEVKEKFVNGVNIDSINAKNVRTQIGRASCRERV